MNEKFLITVETKTVLGSVLWLDTICNQLNIIQRVRHFPRSLYEAALRTQSGFGFA